MLLSGILPAILLGQLSITLADSFWEITIDPSSLAVSAIPAGSKRPIVLSAAEGQHFQVSGIRRSGETATWEVTGRGIDVTMHLANGALDVEFMAKSAGDFTWPILPAQSANLAYLLPIGEGC